MTDAAPLFLTSGDLTADRRYDYARDLLARGDAAAAADLLAQAVEIAPRFASAWFMLGELRAQAGDRDGALAAFRQALAVDPDDRHGARLHLMRLGAEPLAAMPAAYVRAVFDQYAPRFDHALVEGLSYRGPELLRAAVRTACDARGRLPHFARALDLGCGTGLGARAFADMAGSWCGVDLSPGMIAHARATGLYVALAAGDMLDFLRAQGAASADLVLAADAVVYVSDHAPLWHEAARVLMPGGVLAFTVETHASDGVILRDTLRYAHGAAHVTAALRAAGFDPVTLDAGSTRKEAGVPVPGLIAVAFRTAA